MILRKPMTAVKKKRGHTKPGSGESIFIGERRKYPRFTLDLPLDYAIESVDRRGGIAANASKGGLLAYLTEAIVVGTSLKIEILFAMGSEMNTIGGTAKVVWSDLAPKEIWRGYRYGLEFEKFQEGDVRKLKTLLREADEPYR